MIQVVVIKTSKSRRFDRQSLAMRNFPTANLKANLSQFHVAMMNAIHESHHQHKSKPDKSYDNCFKHIIPPRQ